MRILITGANGFIGSHLLRRLSAGEGIEAVGMARKTSALFRLEEGSYDLRYAALDDPLEEVVRGFDAVIHTAARSSDWGDYDTFYRANVEGTANLLQACIAEGVGRFIHFSSTVVYGFAGNRLTTEEKPFAPFDNPYCLTKVEAEKVLLPFRDRIHLVILRPSNVFGPDDLTTTYPLLDALRKGMPGFPAGGRYLTSPCCIDNLVAATGLALNAGCSSGEAFNISDGNDMPWREFLALLAAGMGVRPPRLAIPAGPLLLAASGLEKLYTLLHSSHPPIITPYRIAQVVNDYSFATEKAERVLGYSPPVPTDEGVKQSVRWYTSYRG